MLPEKWRKLPVTKRRIAQDSLTGTPRQSARHLHFLCRKAGNHMSEEKEDHIEKAFKSKTWSEVRNTLVVVIVALLSLLSCEPKELRDCLEGEGSTVLVERTLEEINALSIDLPCAIEIYQDTNIRYGTVDIVAQRNVINNISITTRDSTATLSFKKCFKAHEDITLKFRIPNLNELTVNSATKGQL